MYALLSRVPRTVLRHRNGGLQDVAPDDVAPGDLPFIRAAYRAGRWRCRGTCRLDESAGRRGDAGACHAGDAEMSGRPMRARHSTCARRGGPQRPMPGSCGWSRRRSDQGADVAAADRYSLGFLALTVAIAGPPGGSPATRSGRGGSGRGHALPADPCGAGRTVAAVAGGAVRRADQGREGAENLSLHRHHPWTIPGPDPRAAKNSLCPAGKRLFRGPFLRPAASVDQAQTSGGGASRRCRRARRPSVPTDIVQPGRGVQGRVGGRG